MRLRGKAAWAAQRSFSYAHKNGARGFEKSARTKKGVDMCLAIVGAFLGGAFVGVTLMALMVAASNADDRMGE